MSSTMEKRTDAACGYHFDATHFSLDFRFSIALFWAGEKKAAESSETMGAWEVLLQNEREFVGVIRDLWLNSRQNYKQ